MSEPSATRLGIVREAFSRQAERFDAYAAGADPNTGERFAAALGPAATGRILDVACGTGVVTAALAAGATKVIGVDATEAMLARARARCAGLRNVRFRTADAGALPFADGSFDGAVTRLALHHFAEPARVLAEIARILRPGGRAVVVDVTCPDDPDRAALQNAIEVLRDPSHVRMLPAAEIDRLVALSGLVIVGSETWEKTRDAEDWLAVAADAALAGALATVLRALAAAGVDAGIGLALHDGRVRFTHRWRLVAAERPAPGAAP